MYVVVKSMPSDKRSGDLVEDAKGQQMILPMTTGIRGNETKMRLDYKEKNYW